MSLQLEVHNWLLLRHGRVVSPFNLDTGEEGHWEGMAWGEIASFIDSRVYTPTKATNTAHAWHLSEVNHRELQSNDQGEPNGSLIVSPVTWNAATATPDDDGDATWNTFFQHGRQGNTQTRS